MKNLLEVLLEVLPKNPIFRIVVLYPIVCALVVKFCAFVLGVPYAQSEMVLLVGILWGTALFIDFAISIYD